MQGLALLGTVLAASALGSVHCAVMCGPLVSACHAGGPRRKTTEVAYQLARGLSYVGLGAVSGSVGAAVDWAGRGAGVLRAAAVVSGVLVVVSGLFWLVPGLGRTAFGGRLARAMGARWVGGGLLQLRRQRPALRGAALGVLTPILPCGYLYAFVLSAAGTGTPLGGASLMAAFWLGTLPALVLVGAVVQRLSGLLRERLPLLTGFVLVLMGVLGVLGRGLSAPVAAERTPSAALRDLQQGESHEHAACH